MTPATATVPRRILLVEDHAATRLTLQQLLRNRHHQVTVAESATKASQLARTGEFDLVISDVGLPDRSGYELMADLRSMHPGLPGIALSGYGMEEDLQRSKAAGFAVHLVKPVTITMLEEAIASLPPAAPPPRQQPVPSMNILIVDDKPNLVRVTTVALRTLGCQAYGANTVAAAAQLLATQKIDGVFLDLNLGGENGFDLLDQLEGRPVHPPVVIFTSHTRDEVATEALNRGAFDCLLKPFTLDDLRQQLLKIEQYHKQLASSKPGALP